MDEVKPRLVAPKAEHEPPVASRLPRACPSYPTQPSSAWQPLRPATDHCPTMVTITKL